MTIHERVLEAALRLCRQGGGWTFRSKAVVAALPNLNPGSVRTHVMSRCCVNAPSNHPHRWPYFRRVRRGVYLVQPAWRSNPTPAARTDDVTRADAGTGSTATADTCRATAREPVVTVRESAAGYTAEMPGMHGTVRAASLAEMVDRVRAGRGGPLLLRLVSAPEQADPIVTAYMRDIDRTLVRQSLRMTHEERLLALQDWMNATDEARGAAGRKRRRRVR